MWILLFLSLIMYGQDKTELTYQPANGWGNITAMDDVYFRAKALKDDEVIIVISRLGKDEDPRLNLYRLQQIKSFLVNERKLSLEKFVFAQGEPTNDYGRVEIYSNINTQLRYTLVAPKKLGLPLCCDCDSWAHPKFSKSKKRSKDRLKRSH